ncbi:MAG: BMP family ABC transporter substrate-binding protein [Deferribacteraceae bacterium]|jgi:basic membrane protein A|nr:BMP family ABC transporter substrate-binding protein [Deferribacteraceae bacterium]
MATHKNLLNTVIFVIIMTFAFTACKRTDWKPGTPMSKDKLKIGVVHISNPFTEKSGYAYTHETGIQEMKKKLNLADNQLIYKTDIDDADPIQAENAMRELIAQKVNVIIATSWKYMDVCEKLAAEFPSVIFAHASGIKNNDTNFTNYFGRVYQARYLSGIAAGAQTETGKIGYVAAMGKDNSEVTGGINAFALGVEKVNPGAQIYVKVTYSWFDPIGEASAARELIAEGCDIIAQHCDTPTPQIEAEKAGVWGIGYNSDMTSDAPAAVLTSVIWRWGVYYTALAESIVNGTFTSVPWFGSLKDGIVGLSPFNKNTRWKTDVLLTIKEESDRIESGAHDVFFGVMETNDGRRIGKTGKNLSDNEIRSGINWYYRTVTEM